MPLKSLKVQPIVFLLFFSLILVPPPLIFAKENKSEPDASAKPFELEEITVTAEKREQDVQKIPASISVLSKTQLEDFYIKTTPDIVSMTPNLYITKTGPANRESFAAIRGISGSMNANPAVGFYVDDVYYQGLDIALLDVERVEVLRGPQSTLYGRNSEAGIINIVTVTPPNEWQSKLNLDAGSFKSYGIQGSTGGPIVNDLLKLKASVRYFETDGYFENKADGSKDAGREENVDGRIVLQAMPMDNLDITISYDLQRYDSPKYANFALLDSDNLRKDITVDYPGETSKDADGVALHAEYQMNGMKLVSISSGRDENYFLSNDIDFMPIDLTKLTMTHDVESFSQEFRLFSDESDSLFQWLGGLFILSEKTDEQIDIWMNFMNMGMGMPGETLFHKSKTDTFGIALFGEATYTFLEHLNLTLGLRYDREQKDFDFSKMPGGMVLAMMGNPPVSGSEDETFDAWLPKAALNYQLSEQVMPYITISRGFRSGSFNTVEEMGSKFKPEFTWNYELGAKTSWMENRLQFNMALFYIDWTDMQVEVLTAGGATVYIDNAGKASSKGAELELMARPFSGLELIAGAAYTDAKYEDYAQGMNVYDDNRVVDSPKYTLNIGATYRFNGGFFANASYNHFGEIYFDPANTQSQGSYGIANAKIGYETESFDVYLYGKNIFDEEYATRAFEVSNQWYGRSGAPQIFGIALTGRF